MAAGVIAIVAVHHGSKYLVVPTWLDFMFTGLINS